MYTNLSYLSSVLSLIKRLSKAIYYYLCSRDVYKLNLTIFNSALNIVIVDVNVLCTLIVAF
jgi:hypothetical protein